MNVLFLTDAHFNQTPESLTREQEMCRLLDSVKNEIDALVLLGDMFDFWFSFKYVVPKGHVRLLGKLAELADRGIQIHYFIGNHDMWMFDYLQQLMPIHMYADPTLLQFDGHTFMIGHGDGLGHLDHKYDLLKKIFRSPLNQKLFTLLPSRLTFFIAHHWSNHSRHSHSTDTLRYLGDDKEGIVIWIKQQLLTHHIDYCVFGHRHTPLSRTLTATNQQQTQYINVGDWFLNRTYALYQNHTLKLYTWPDAKEL